jgi:hypothetical protein
MKNQKLIFVYNADSGLINTVEDYFHKIVKPSTYQCNLCALTFGNLGMKKDWKNYIDELKVDVEFLHKDEFDKEYGLKEVKFPAGFLKSNTDIKLFITANEINELKTLDELMEFVSKKLSEI